MLLWGSGRDAAPLVPWLSPQLEGWDMREGGKARGSGPGPADANLVSAPSLQSAIPFLIAVVVLDSSLFVTYVVAVAAGISVAAAFLLPW